MKNKIFYLSSFIFLFCTFNTQAQISRGAEENEIYLSTDWYMDNYGYLYWAIFHSTDNGEHISLKYENIESPPAGEMMVGKILGDATPGVLYNFGFYELWVSFDYGENWMYREYHPTSSNYFSGQNNGTIFKRISYQLFQSDDYGNLFALITNSISCPIIEPGYYLGEFFGINGNTGERLFLDHTLDYANTYTEISIDSAVAFWSPSGQYPQISRGSGAGELYLVSWWPDYHYKIFHSVDTGNNWAEKFESEFINVFYWQLSYTAGREPGSFYVMRSTLDPTFNHKLLYIDYSIDYGETFSTYFHDIDSTLSSINSVKKKALKLTCFPNPFSEKTTISFELPENCKNPELNICNIKGNMVRQYDILGKKAQQWDGKDNNGTLIPNGVYLYNINYDDFTSKYKKILLIN